MSRIPDLNQFRYKNGTLVRSAAMSWRPQKWTLGPGAHADVSAGASNGLLAAPVFLTVTTPDGDVVQMQAYGRKGSAEAHKMAARINADSRS